MTARFPAARRLIRVARALAWGLPLAALAQAPAAPAAPTPSPQSQAALVLGGEGPYHRLLLPPALHGRVWQGELSRLRIVNAAGQAVPWSWLGQEPGEPPRTASATVPLYAWPAPAQAAAAADAAPVFGLDAGGRLRLLAPPPPRSGAPESAGWLIDASAVRGPLLQMRVVLPAGVQGLFPFTLQASEDLQQWRPVGDEGQLLRLPAPAAPPGTVPAPVLERLSVDLQGVRARFLRLMWRDAARAPDLLRVQIDSEERNGATAAAPLWSGPIAPAVCEAQHCDYVLPVGWPLSGLRVHLAQANTLSSLTVAGVRPPAPIAPEAGELPQRLHNPLYALRRHAQRPPPAPRTVDEWPLFDTVVYRIAQAGGEARSADLALDGAVWPTLRLRTPDPIAALGTPPPTLEVASLPRTLVFLAQGPAPYALHWPEAVPGTRPGPAAGGGPLPLATLMPGQDLSRPLPVGEAQVQAQIAERAPEAVAPPQAGMEAWREAVRPYWLWGALGLGLLLLAAMAVSLLRSTRAAARQAEANDDDED